MTQLSFTIEELIKLKNGLDYLPNSVNLSKQYFDECIELMKKIDYIIEHLRRQKRTADKFVEWRKSVNDDKLPT